MVQLHMLETLRIIVNTANSEFLNDATQWHILYFCCLNLTKAGKRKTLFSPIQPVLRFFIIIFNYV